MSTRKTFSISGKIVDVAGCRIFEGTLHIKDGKIARITEGGTKSDVFLIPGLIDSHIHIESSMLTPVEFARLAVVHGTVGAVSDPHEIANVLGVKGVEFMIANARHVPFKFWFGAPSCVPATGFETSGAKITPDDIKELLKNPEIRYLAEMMNFPGVLARDEEVIQKIRHAKNADRVIDGHAPGLQGDDLKRYVSEGITTDHECSTIGEAEEKLALGMKILIREGSAARDFDTLIPLMASNSSSLMFCSDDKHPDDLVDGHINLLVKKAIALGYDIFDVLRSATLIPKLHYGINNGLLQQGDPADLVVVDNLKDFNVLETYIEGVKVADRGKTLLESVKEDAPNRFHSGQVATGMLKVKSRPGNMRVIQVVEGQLFTKSIEVAPRVEHGFVEADTGNDILKLVALNRYEPAPPALAFIKGFGLKSGALATTVAHDSHNILAVGTNDNDIIRAINLLIESHGGIVAVEGSRHWLLPLPVAGIMTQNDGYQTAKWYKLVDLAAKNLGTTLQAPFMTLSFMALLVIPELKLSDRGLFDVKSFSLIPLFSE